MSLNPGKRSPKKTTRKRAYVSSDALNKIEVYSIASTNFGTLLSTIQQFRGSILEPGVGLRGIGRTTPGFLFPNGPGKAERTAESTGFLFPGLTPENPLSGDFGYVSLSASDALHFDHVLETGGEPHRLRPM
jgi:hypothetical protein